MDGDLASFGIGSHVATSGPRSGPAVVSVRPEVA
jgi:hypothetical protein